MTRKLKFIHVGTGGFGAHWCKNVLPYVVNRLQAAELVAAVDINPEAHKNVMDALQFDPQRIYTDLRQALQEHPCDFVTIVIPPFAHEYAVDLALEFNCHILMEKPIAEDMESSCRVYHKVKQSGKKMSISMSHRYDQDKKTLEALIKSGDYGKLHYLIGRFTTNNRAAVNNPKEYAHHNFLISSVIHHFDIIRSLTGANAKTVYTQSWNPDWAPFKEHATALIQMEMENGARAFFEGSKTNAATLNGWTQDYFRAECELATLELNHREIKLRSDLNPSGKINRPVPLLEGDCWSHQLIIKEFMEWVQGGPKPANTIDDSIQSTGLQFAAIQSGMTKQIVDVQEFLGEYLDKTASH
ncbi:MAG: oxidoreductase domain protein [Paenibacillaceae bacterium]|nr:oxidoreductase domain protein [Paenibacillaceae bacterium]